MSPVVAMDLALRRGWLPWFAEMQALLSPWGLHGGGMRHPYALHFGYAIPCREVIEVIAACGPLLEVGAGGGYWASWLRRMGCDVIATDPKVEPYPYGRYEWTDVLQLDAAEATRRFPGRNILMVWPRPESTWCIDVVRGMVPGQLLCYVGAGPFGCCAPPQFFLELYSGGFVVLDHRPCPAWPPNLDYLTVYGKR